MIFFKKKSKYLTIQLTDETFSIIKFSEIVLINYDCKFYIEILLKNGNLFKIENPSLKKRKELYEQIKKILQNL